MDQDVRDTPPVDNNPDSNSIKDIDESELMLSTIDNPFNPKTDYDNWKTFDTENGYETEAYIARLISMESDYEVDDEFMLNLIMSNVIDDILANDDQGIYVLV